MSNNNFRKKDNQNICIEMNQTIKFGKTSIYKMKLMKLKYNLQIRAFKSQKKAKKQSKPCRNNRNNSKYNSSRRKRRLIKSPRGFNN